MADFDYNIVKVTSPAAGTPRTVITGVGFRPKAAIIYGTRTSGTQGLASAFRCGIDDGTTRYSKAINAGTFAGGLFCDGWMSNAYSFLAMRTQGLNQLMLRGLIESWDADGFTVRWDFNNVATGVNFYVVVLGGSVFEAKVLGLQPTTSPFSISSLTFTPTALFGFHLGDTFNDVLLPGDQSMAVGFAGAVECGQATLWHGYDSSPAGGITNCKSYQTTGEWMTVLNSSTGAVTKTNTITSLDANGFTITNTGGGTYGVLAMKGCAINVGAFVQNLSAGAQNVTLLASSPKLAFLMSDGKAASASAVDDQKCSFGAAYPGTHKMVWTGSLDNQASNLGDSVEDDNYLGMTRTPTGNPGSTLTGRVSLQSLTSTNMGLNWDPSDGSSTQWIYAVFCEVGASACGVGGISVGTGIILRTDTADLADDGEEFEAYIISRAMPPAGSIDRMGEVRDPQLTARAQAYSVGVTVIRDHYRETQLSTISLAGEGSERYVVRKCDGVKLSDCKMVQVKIGDTAPIESAWALAHFHMIEHDQGESQR